MVLAAGLLPGMRSVQLPAREADRQVERPEGLRDHPGLLLGRGQPGRPDDHGIPAGYGGAGGTADPAYRNARDRMGCETAALRRPGEPANRDAFQAVSVGVAAAGALCAAGTLHPSSRLSASGVWTSPGSAGLGLDAVD